MDNKVRVLVLDDDNHEPTFCEEYGHRSHGYMDFILRMKHMRDTDFDIRSVYICDMPEGMEDDFDAVDTERSDIPYKDAFERLWKIGEVIS